MAITRRGLVTGWLAAWVAGFFGVPRAARAQTGRPAGPFTASVAAFGAAGDGIRDDRAAIQAALDAAKAGGGGTVLLDARRYLIGGGLVIDSAAVSLIGLGAGQSANRADWNRPADRRSPRTELLAGGSFPGGTPMLTVWSDPAGDTRGLATSGVRVQGIFLDAAGRADICIRARSVHNCHFFDLFGRHFRRTGFEIDASVPNAADHRTWNRAVRLCSFDMIAMHAQGAGSATGVLVTGDDHGDVNYCRFGRLQIATHDGPGLKLEGCDTNLFEQVYTFTTGAGHGIDIGGGERRRNRRARENTILQADCVRGGKGVGGIISRAAPYPPNGNVVLNYGSLNRPGEVVIEEGSQFHYQQARHRRLIDDDVATDFFISNGQRHLLPRAIAQRVSQARLPDGSLGNRAMERTVAYGTAADARFRQEWWTHQRGRLARQMWLADGLVLEGASTGERGHGTVNARAVYDDDVLLTCYVIEAWLDGAVDVEKWDRLVPDRPLFDPETGEPTGETEPRRHEPARGFARVAAERLDLDAYLAAVRSRRRLPAFPGPEEFSDPEKFAGAIATGDAVQRLWETVELQAVHIAELHERVKALERTS